MLRQPRHDAQPGVNRQEGRWIGDMAGSTLLGILGQWRSRNKFFMARLYWAQMPQERQCEQKDGSQSVHQVHLRRMSQAKTSAFSPALHSRAKTSLQLRLNHLSTFAESVKLLGLKAGARGSRIFPVDACRLLRMGKSPWQLAHDQSAPCFFEKNSCPPSGLPGRPASRLNRSS